jgi:hypothetical protein
VVIVEVVSTHLNVNTRLVKSIQKDAEDKLREEIRYELIL